MAKSTKYGKPLLLQGQAGVWRVASELGLRGIVPNFPGVDLGYDLILESGLRLQVRSATLTITGSDKYPYCSYLFSLNRSRWYSGDGKERNTYAAKKPFSAVADYFVLWGIDEGRFFIVPTSTKLKSIYFPKRNFAGNWIQRKQRSTKRMDDKLGAYEDRWDLLDVADISNKLIESAAVVNGVAQQERV